MNWLLLGKNCGMNTSRKVLISMVMTLHSSTETVSQGIYSHQRKEILFAYSLNQNEECVIQIQAKRVLAMRGKKKKKDWKQIESLLMEYFLVDKTVVNLQITGSSTNGNPSLQPFLVTSVLSVWHQSQSIEEIHIHIHTQTQNGFLVQFSNRVYVVDSVSLYPVQKRFGDFMNYSKC